MAQTRPAGRPCASLRLVGTPALVPPVGEAVALERKDAALLALLATAGATPRAGLAALLWPDVDAEGARNNLRQRLFRLKRAAGVDVVAGGNVVSLADLVVHDLAALPVRLAADPQALAGELLGAFDYSDCTELAAWVDVAREQWRAALRDALAEIAARLEGERQIAQALAYAQRLVCVDPLLEHAHRRVMRLYYLLGERSAALAAYEQARVALERGLGVPPGAETERLAELIRSGSASASPALGPSSPALLWPPRLVGREPEWAALADATVARRSVLVRGEAGIGKTRLLSDFAAHHGAALLMAARPGDVHLPHALLSRLVRRLAPHTSAPLADWVTRELARIAPELGPAPVAPLDPLRLQQAASELLAQRRAGRVALIALDDLHFADDATLDMLPSLTTAPGGEAIAWLMSARSGEMPTALGRWCAAQDTEGPLEMTLGPLDDAAIEAFLESLALPELDAAAWTAPLARHTGGNPLFILETLRAMRAEGSLSRDGLGTGLPAPLNIGQLVARRLDQLPAPAFKLARVAAIAGPDFSVALAAAVLGQDALEIADAWRQLEAAQVMRERGFAHDLIHEATLRSVPAAIAKVMHGEIAAQLEAQGAAAARIAQHWFEAGEFARAADCFERSGHQAQ
ncbi:MAG: AAA family ATPase [Rubrivivax sp.]|nr:AAA family ATPase [Rubrivivax sp.]